eukprot:1196142-Amphidinium_carterae.1
MEIVTKTMMTRRRRKSIPSMISAPVFHLRATERTRRRRRRRTSTLKSCENFVKSWTNCGES